MRLEISIDDGHQLDFKAIELLKKYELPATFYIPSNTDLLGEEIKEIAKDFEIGGHTVNHLHTLKDVDDITLKHEIEDNKTWLEEIIGRKITSFCYPRGRYDERIKKAVKDAGFTEARTTKVLCIDKPTDPFEKGTSIHCYQRKEYENIDWLELASSMYQECLKKPDSVFHVWAHSWELEKNDEWDKFEELLKTISEYLKK